tara:strand:+ start:157 stop:1617 length:1461 start_codon:yes stop_codon:yes gene_type:complete
MKLYKNDLFQKSKFKSYLTILTVIFIVFYILKLNLKHYFAKHPSSKVHMLFDSILSLDGTKLLILITSIFREIVKDISKILLFEIDIYLDGLVKMNNLLVKMANAVNLSNLHFFGMVDKLKQSIINSIFPVFKGMFKIRDIFKKISGVLTTVLFTLLSTVMTSSALLGSLVQIITALLVMVVPLIIASFFFNFPLAVVLSIMYVAVAVPMVLIAVETGKIYDLTSPSRNFSKSNFSTKKPHCFHRNTEIQTKRGLQKIVDLTINDYVKVKDFYVKITGLTKHCGKDQVFYNINGIFVTEKHPIRYNGEWISVCDHPNSIKVNINEEYVFCLTTKEKVFQVGNELFLDWDEFDEKIQKKTKICNYDVDYFTSYLDENTFIKMEDDSIKKLRDIQIGDVLKNKTRVVGKINLGDKQIYCYRIKNNLIKGSRNLIYFDDGEKYTTLDTITVGSPFIGRCVQIFTENQKLSLINNIILGDYDTSLENLIY